MEEGLWVGRRRLDEITHAHPVVSVTMWLSQQAILGLPEVYRKETFSDDHNLTGIVPPKISFLSFTHPHVVTLFLSFLEY